MATDDRDQRLRQQRQAFADWWAGPRDRPYILQRCGDYCVCDVILPRWIANARFNARFAAAHGISKLPSSRMKVWLYRRMGMRIGRGVYIAPGVHLDAFYPSLIEIADGAFLGGGCRLLTHEYTATAFRAARVRIGPGAVVGGWSIVRSGVTVGARATTGLGSVVVDDVPEDATVIGVPARPLRARETA